MELRHFRYLIAIAEEGSFVAAAARLSLAQPALSRQISDLEREIGVPLFVREASGSPLTAAGATVLSGARRVLESASAAMERARLADHGLAGRCVLGVGRYPLWNGQVAKLVDAVRRDHPGVDIVIDERSLRDQWNALTAGEIDIGLDVAPFTDPSDLVVEEYATDVIDGVMVADFHALARQSAVTLNDLAKETQVRLLPGVGDEPTRTLQAALASRNVVLAGTRMAENDHALRMLVGSGAGWSAIPGSVRDQLPRGLVFVAVDGLAVPIRYAQIHRRGDRSPLVRSLLAAIRRHLGNGIDLDGARRSEAGARLPTGKRDGYASRIELRHLRYFDAAVRHETLGRAAERLGITQPALSRQVHDLEAEVGASLLQRTARGVITTPAGESLHGDVQRILTVVDNLPLEAQKAVRSAAGQCVVGAAATALVWEVVTKAIATSSWQSPDVSITVAETSSPEQFAALRESRVDLAIGHHSLSAPAADPNIIHYELLPDPLNMALVHAEHPLAKRSEIDLNDLAGLPFLFMRPFTNERFYERVMSAFARVGFVPRIEAEYDGQSTTWALAAKGMGWTIGVSSQFGRPPNGLAAIRLRDFELRWGCDVAYRRDEKRASVLTVLASLRAAASDVAMLGMTKASAFQPQSGHSRSAHKGGRHPAKVAV